MTGVVHRWDLAKLVCTDCGALGQYSGTFVVAMRCTVDGCCYDAVIRLGRSEFRCDEHKSEGDDDDDDD